MYFSSAVRVVMRISYTIIIARNPIELPSSRYEPIIERATAISQTIMFVNMLNIMTTILRQIKYFHFQPRMAVISQTIQESSTDLGHFAVLFTIMFGSFCMMAQLLFGPHVESFRSVGLTVQSMAEILLGNYDIESMHSVASTMSTVLFWLYIVVIFYFLTSIFVSIIIDAYSRQKSSLKIDAASGSIVRDLIEWGRTVIVHRASTVGPLHKTLQYYVDTGHSTVTASMVETYLAEELRLRQSKVDAQRRVLDDLPIFPSHSNLTSQTMMSDIFASYDGDKDGALTCNEFAAFVRQADVGLSERAISDIIHMLDCNANGVIELEEFQTFATVLLQHRFTKPTKVNPTEQ